MAVFQTKLILLLVITQTLTHPEKISDLIKNLEKDSLLRDSEDRTDATEQYVLNTKTTKNLYTITTENHKNDDTNQYDDDNESTDATTTNEPTTEVEDRSMSVEKLAEVDARLYRDYFDVNDKSDPTTESDTAETESLSVIDNVDSNNINNSLFVNKIETSSAATTKEIEELEAIGPTLVGFEELDGPEQRSLKTGLGNQEVKPQHHPEPQPTAAASSKSSTLRRWLDDQWLRPPVGILVPLRPLALNRALAVWTDLSSTPLTHSDIVLVGYHRNGVNWRSRHNLQFAGKAGQKTGRTVSEALSKLLIKYQGVNIDSSSDGTMQALASAAKLVPYDSALFVVTDRGAGDPEKLPLALRALLEKRLKVYTIWTDPGYPSEESKRALQDMRNISLQTEGEVLPYSLQVTGADSLSTAIPDREWPLIEFTMRQSRYHSTPDNEKFDTLLVWRGGGEAMSLGVPVENGVTALRIYIEGLVEHAVLYPPNDAPQVDLYNVTSVLAFSPTSRTDRLSPRDVYLAFPGADLEPDMLSVLPMNVGNPMDSAGPTVGLWHLSVRCDTCDYRLCITARTATHLYAATEQSGEMLKLRVVGPVASVRESFLVDEYGIELAKLPFSYEPISSDGQERKDGSPELMVDVPMPKVKGGRIYVKIVGRDLRGEPFIRLAGPLNQETKTNRAASAQAIVSQMYQEMSDANNKAAYQQLRYNDSTVLPSNRALSQVVNQRGTILTSVQIGLSTRLYGAPGDSLQLHYEVTNYREQTIKFKFEAVGELRFLRAITPAAQNILSGQTVVVIVSLTIGTAAQPGARDLVTFTAYGLEQVSISSYVYVTNSGESTADVWSPEVRHNFQGSCIGRQGQDCAQHVWSATIVARDAQSGLLRLTSTPIGVTYDSNFISGSREEVFAVYRATCCAPRVLVTAVDALGNANSQVIDISSYLSEAAVASIVLGVFLFIALIALIILVYWCVRKRRESRELPSYATSSRN